MTAGWRAVPMPLRIAALPTDDIGRPVPWFAATIDGRRDFRVIRTNGITDATRFKLCWVCGQPRGTFQAFLIGPMCAVNRVSAEPPSHLDCATYSAQTCPFLVRPQIVRRDGGLPEDLSEPAGTMLKRNPGVALVWVTKRHEVEMHPAGLLFRLGPPVETRWYAEGRTATASEITESITTGLPLLRESAAEDGPDAERLLDAMVATAQGLVPAGVQVAAA